MASTDPCVLCLDEFVRSGESSVARGMCHDYMARNVRTCLVSLSRPSMSSDPPRAVAGTGLLWESLQDVVVEEIGIGEFGEVVAKEPASKRTRRLDMDEQIRDQLAKNGPQHGLPRQ